MNIAIIDTETNFNNDVMTIGIVIANENYDMIDSKYYVLIDECKVGGMFSDRVLLKTDSKSFKCNRCGAIFDIKNFLNEYNVTSIFAYNAKFDYTHLCELSNYNWYDIMRIAAYRQYNYSLCNMECTKTGRLKCGYGVENIIRMLTNNYRFIETHNAVLDAKDELSIMKYLGHSLSTYLIAKI